MTNLTSTQPTRGYTLLSTTPEQTAQNATAAQQNRAGTSPSLPATLRGTDTASSVQITLSQAGLDFLAQPRAATTPEQAAAQEALVRLDRLASSSHTEAREEAEERVNTIKAQIHQLMQIKDLLSPKALAQELAQLARQLAAAVAQYTQSGGSSTANAAAGNAVLAATQTTPSTSSPTQAASSLHTDVTTTDPQQPATTLPDAQTTAQGSTPATKTDNDQGFAQAVQGLSAQMKALLAQNRLHLQKLHITSDSDTQTAQNALETVSQLIPKI